MYVHAEYNANTKWHSNIYGWIIVQWCVSITTHFRLVLTSEVGNNDVSSKITWNGVLEFAEKQKQDIIHIVCNGRIID